MPKHRCMKLPPPDLPPPSLPTPSANPSPTPPLSAAPAVEQPLNPYAPPVSALKVEDSTEPDLEFASGAWSRVVREALAYPMRPQNLMGLVVAAVVVSLVSITKFAPLVGIPVFLGGLSYIAAYYFQIVELTINGRSDMPDWPDWSSYWDDFVIPGFQMLVISILSYLPLFVSLMCLDKEQAGLVAFSEIFGMLFAAAYFPMATLGVVCSGSVAGAMPHRVIPAILRCLPGYLLCVGLFVMVEIVRSLSGFGSGLSLPWMLVIGFVGIYGMFVQARLTGMIYLRSSEKLPW